MKKTKYKITLHMSEEIYVAADKVEDALYEAISKLGCTYFIDSVTVSTTQDYTVNEVLNMIEAEK